MEARSPFDFIFVDAQATDRTQLAQGDLLKRTPELAEAVGQAHSYYAEANDYTHFLILTQSCDLVRRASGCKTRYITICAVRPLSVAVDREMSKFTNEMEGFPFRVGDLDRGILARQYLDRVMNNTVDGMFFIPRGSADTVDEHLCAFLPLSIALRTSHYDICLGAKVAQAEEIFAAKIGSLASGLYGRIATPDLHEKRPESVNSFKEEFFEELGYASVAWLSPVQKKALKARVKTVVTEQGGTPITPERAEKILSSLPNEATDFVERTIQILLKRKLLADDEITLGQARTYLLNDPSIKKLARTG